MRLVLSWLRELVDVRASADDVASTLGRCGFQIASIEALDGGDAVIDLEVTANRQDCLSVVGLAREIATAFDLPLRRPSHDVDATVRLERLPIGPSDRLTVTVEDPERCPRFAAAVAEVSLGPSHAWMANRLRAAGVRPISTIVDVTNYVRLELGQPMRAFDLDKLAGPEIRVRRARPGESITTLDGVRRPLEPEMLVIADCDHPQAIAGVMGGADSEISSATRTVALESASFEPISVHRTSKRLGLETEASLRFERGGDLGVQVTAIERTAALLTRLGAGRIVGPVVDCYPHPRSPRTLHLRRERLARLFGMAVPDADVARILEHLELRPTTTPDGWDVVVPLFRVDVLREVDLISAVGRHYGFDRLTPTFPPSTQPAPPSDPRLARDRLVRRVLTAAGASEAVTFGFVDAKAAEPFHADGAAAVTIANPLSAKFDTLRPLILPGLVDAVAHNRRHGSRDVKLFEVGARFAASGETRGVGIAWTGAATMEHWSAPVREVDFFDIKGIVERLCDALGVAIAFAASRRRFLVPGQAATIVANDGTATPATLGIAGQLLPAIADSRGLPRQDRVLIAELDLDALAAARLAPSDATRALPRFPPVVRDLSIVVANVLPAAVIRGTILAAARDASRAGAPLAATSFFDRYRGKGVPAGSISLSVRLTFQADDRTLTDAEVQASFDTILAALVREHGAVQR